MTEMGATSTDSNSRNIISLSDAENSNLEYLLPNLFSPVPITERVKLELMQNTTTTTVAVKTNSNLVKNKIKNTTRMKKGQRYVENFKQKVLEYAVNNSFQKAAVKFNVSASTVTEWAREYKRLVKLKKSTSTISCGDKFIDWLRGQRAAGVRVGREHIMAAAQTVRHGNTNDWFELWVRRLQGHTVQHIFYPDEFKFEVVLFAKEYTKKVAAGVFGLSTRRIYDWCSPEPGELSINKTKYQIERQIKNWYESQLVAGVKPRGSEVMTEARALYAANGMSHIKCSKGWLDKFIRRHEIKLLHNNDECLLMWVLDRLDNNCAITIADITLKARELATREGSSSIFKGSKSWALQFLKRHNQLLQYWNTKCDMLPLPFIRQSRIFRRAIQDRLIAGELSSGSIGCMDEIPIRFKFPSDEVRTPRLLRQTTMKSAIAVIILSATSDGRLLPPAVIFKGCGANDILYEQKIPVFYQDEGSVNVDILSHWFSQVWTSYVEAPSMMIADCYEPHQNQVLHSKLSAGNCSLAVIPAGCALVLQPFAYNISQCFEDLIQDEWREWCRINNGAWQADEKTILKWALKAYDEMRQDSTSIISSFKLSIEI